MTTTAAAVSRWARAFVVSGVCFLVAWQAAELGGVGRRTAVVLGVYGFVFHVIFGQAYSLLPAYFDREFTATRVPPVALALSLTGTVLLAAGSVRSLTIASRVGALCWAGAVALVVGSLVVTVRGNLTGAETGTSEANADRRRTDRVANAVVPLVFAYLVAGAYGTLGRYLPVPTPFPVPAAVTHLLAAGAAALLVFAVGTRLLTRFLVVDAPRPLVWVVLPCGAVGPALLVAGFGGGWLFRLGALLEATAVVGFAGAYALMYRRSERRRVGFRAVLVGVTAGALAVALGLHFVFVGWTAPLARAHLRLNVLGFLGLTIVGVVYQFYPPAVGSFDWCTDRTAHVSIACLGGGLLAEVAGLVADLSALTAAGRALSLLGALLFAALVAGVLAER